MKLYENREWLYSHYVEEEMSYQEIADLVGCSLVTIHRWVKKHDIPTRSLFDAQIIQTRRRRGDKKPYSKPNRNLLENPEWLYHQYWAEDHTLPELAVIIGCNRNTVRDRMHYYKIPIRTAKQNAVRRWATPGEKEKQSKKFKALWKAGILKTISGKPSSLEVQFGRHLEDQGIFYIAQYSPEDTLYRYDFMIPGANLLIEIDGEFWHHSDLAKKRGIMERDREKDILASERGYKLIRIRERDIEAKGYPYLIETLVIPALTNYHRFH